ncbi:MmgE/PrpD family protein [Ottowia thiooxydans]|uniref:2-methylcitrate dehydratase n=1 Tax=Ottowia thiooxydans TaxID=219182 RepID=A0ABV2Q3U2_9BURK
MSSPAVDLTQAALARFALGVPAGCSEALQNEVRHVLIDSFAVALGALRHPAAIAGRRYGRNSQVPWGARIWGTGEVVSPETAALVNGVPLRGYDFNDVYIGTGCGGHPSDIVPGLVALAETRHCSGQKMLDALVVGYEVIITMMDVIRLGASGWDYPNICAIGMTCAAARLLDLDESQTREALAIAVVPHFASLEIESGELNAAGDLTMWKRFNGSDAIRHAIYACLLAQANVEGAVRPFEGNFGFLAKTATHAEQRVALLDQLHPSKPLNAICRTMFKRWPVGSRGQSAIQAALEVRGQLGDPAAIREVRVFTGQDVHEHLVLKRSAPWAPTSRETADHSLPYIVAVSLLDGRVGVESFSPERVMQLRENGLLDKMSVIPDERLDGKATGFTSRVELTDLEGRVFTSVVKPQPGHRLAPLTDEEFEEKFVDSVTPLFGAERAAELISSIAMLSRMEDVGCFTEKLVAPHPLMDVVSQ